MALNRKISKPSQNLDLMHSVQNLLSLLINEPNNPEIHHNLSICFRKLGLYKKALEHSELAYNFSPESPTIIFSHGISNELVGNIPNAIKNYKEAISLRPNYPKALNNLGRLLDEQNLPLEAKSILEKALILDNDNNDIRVNLANNCIALGAPANAEKLINNIKTPEALNAMGICKYIQRKFEDAEYYFSETVKSSPHFAGAHENLALTLLHLKKFNRGWKEYLWRDKNNAEKIKKRNLKTPVWDGSNIKNKILLIYSEQGYGDTIQFIRFIKSLEKLDIFLIFACTKDLHRLIKNAFDGNLKLVGFDDIPHHDFHLSLLNLPMILNRLDTYSSNQVPYFLLKQKEKIKKLSDDKKKIGICWKGRPKHKLDPYRNRSCLLTDMEIILDMAEHTIFTLQKDITEEERILLSKKKIKFPKIPNFIETVKIISQLDAVLTVDTAVAHLAGAMGKPVFLVLCFASDWRWESGDGYSKWYPKTFMIRQKVPGDWKTCILQAQKALKIFLEQ